MAERKGAAYRITSKRPASSHDEHTQTTQASHYLSGMNLPGIAEAKKASWDRRYPGAMGPGQGVSAAGDRRAYEQAMLREPKRQPR